MRRRELPIEDEKVRARSFKNATDVWICSGTEAFLMMSDRRDNGTPDERGHLERPKPGTQEHEALARLVDGEQERRTREDLGERDDSIATGGERRRTRSSYRPYLPPKLAFFGGLAGALLGLLDRPSS
jgi:hypothetical protein